MVCTVCAETIFIAGNQAQPCDRRSCGSDHRSSTAIADGEYQVQADRPKCMLYLISPISCNSLRSFPVSIGFIK
jgi:hypothetical protein